jgi:hypothetical protein
VRPGDEPSTVIRPFRGKMWVKYDYGDDWLLMGIAPRPKTVWQTLVYHICHGLIMQYPLRDVLIWSWKNRRSFIENHE